MRPSGPARNLTAGTPRGPIRELVVIAGECRRLEKQSDR